MFRAPKTGSWRYEHGICVYPVAGCKDCPPCRIRVSGLMAEVPSSPVCYGGEADDVYMGFAGRDELLAALNELLEAERAGARVALASARSAGDPAFRELIRSIRADEARWCAMLAGQIGRLGGTPSGRTGEFRQKAMAIPDLLERLAFLNRGQGWVVRKLEALLPRVRDDALHEALRQMLDSHRVNIARASAHLGDSRTA